MPHSPQLGDAELEQIIALGLTRSQIALRFGVGEHAAQLARTRAVAVAGERKRTGKAVPTALGTDVSVLRKEAEVYFEHRQSLPAADWIGTDRTKITLFLDWLEQRA